MIQLFVANSGEGGARYCVVQNRKDVNMGEKIKLRGLWNRIGTAYFLQPATALSEHAEFSWARWTIKLQRTLRKETTR